MNVDGGSLTLGGSVDEGSVAALRTLLAGLSEAGETVVVDLSEVDYLPSFAIGVLAKARSRARTRGVRFDLVAPEGCTAHRVLQIAAIPYVEAVEDVAEDDEVGVEAPRTIGAPETLADGVSEGAARPNVS